MSKKRAQQIDRVEEALRLAYRDRGRSPSLPNGWEQAVMGEIRRIRGDGKAAPGQEGGGPVFRGVILPFATTAAALATALLIYALAAAPPIDQDLFAVLTQDTSGLLTTQILGM